MTSKAGHTFTAGPWRAERTRNGDYRIVYNKTGNWLAEVHADGEPEVEKADASLIAAAPELLAALKQALRYIEVSVAYSGAMTADQVEAAIKGNANIGQTEIAANSCHTLATFDFAKARAALSKATAGGAV